MSLYASQSGRHVFAAGQRNRNAIDKLIFINHYESSALHARFPASALFYKRLGRIDVLPLRCDSI